MNSINETLASEIYNAIEGGEGTFSVEVEAGNGVTVYADGGFEVDGYPVEIGCDLSEIERSIERDLAA